MRKVFLFISVLMFAAMANATSTTISPGSATSDNNIRAAINGTADTIYLNPGEYIQENQIHLKRSVVLMAADMNNKPIIKLKYYCDFINQDSKVTINGLIFDGTVSGQQAIRVYDNQVGKELRLYNCEFFNFAKATIANDNSTYPLDSCIINNCFFHDNKKSALYFVKSTVEGVQTCHGLIVTNSTFANYDVNESAEYYASLINVETYDYSNVVANDVNVLIDHCTFYNYLTYNTDHCAIRIRRAKDVTVSNCIFAHPTAQERRATYLYESTNAATNCLSYNLTKNADNYSHAWGPSVSNCTLGNPVFKNPENNDFTLLNASSARRENGDIYGDPRWHQTIETIAIPATLLPKDAILSDSASVIPGTPDSINYKYVGNKKYNEAEWAKWKVTVDKDGLYNFTAHTYRSSGQKYEIALLNSDESSTLILNDNGKSGIGSGNASISTGIVALEAGNTYTVRVRNIYEYADGVLLNVVASYEGGVTVSVPDTLWPVDAMRSELAFIDENNNLRFTDDNHDSQVREQWGKWNIDLAKAGNYKFTVSANSTNGHAYELILRNSDESSVIASKVQKGSSNVLLTFAMDVNNLADDNYVLTIRDTTKYSHGYIKHIAVSYEGGAVTELPGQIIGEDALLGTTGSKYMQRLENGDLKSHDNSNPTSEYAEWKVSFTEAGSFAVTLNLHPTQSSGHNYRVELYAGETLKDYAEELASTELNAAEHSKGDVALEGSIVVPAAGDYTIKLVNRTQYSTMILHGITFTPYVAPAAITMTDTDTDNSAWIAEKDNTVDVQMNRTILGGMYNTICLPFKLSGAKCKAIFGDDVELYTLGSATLSGDILNLQFDAAGDIWNGTPILIKTSSDIVNPLFEGVTIESETADATNGDFATFRGTFVQKEFHNGDQVLLLLANDKLAYPQQDRTLKGFRAYFQINGGSANAPAIRGARIVAGTQVVTAIDMVNEQNEGIVKTIENGKLIIVRDGVRYNALGIMIK